MPVTTRFAACSCGQLGLSCEGDPVSISVCHCHACQRRTGSPFGEQARWPAARVETRGVASTFVRRGDDGMEITFRFCPTCGATVSYEIDQMPGLVAVPVGAFADPSFPGPQVSVYGARKHAWIRLPEDLEQVD